MKPEIEIFWEWVKKLLGKWFWVLGLVPLVLDYLSAFIPYQFIPLPIRNFLTNGANWYISLVFVIVGLFLSAYLVYREQRLEVSEISRKLNELTNKLPKIEFYFNNNGKYTKRLSLRFNKLPEKPGIEDQLRRKKAELLEKNKKIKGSRYSPPVIGMLPYSDYEKEVEAYLESYKNYLNAVYEAELFNERLIFVKPVIANSGNSSATNVVVKLILPTEYKMPPEETLEIIRSYINHKDRGVEFKVKPPKEPTPFIYDVPQPFLDLSDDDRVKIIFEGPFYEEKGDRLTIIYKIKNLQHKLERDDLEEFVLWLHEVAESTSLQIDVMIYNSESPEPFIDKTFIDIQV